MSRSLDAAGITDPVLRDSYERCRALNAEHGKTYYLATLLLPPAKRPFVHALYGFARYADEIVDAFDDSLTVARRSTELDRFGASVLADLDRGSSVDPVCAAVVDTARRFDIPRAHFEAFLDSMRMDLDVTSYATYEDLFTYVYGSAAVIGLQMVPILEPIGDPQVAAASAMDLGVAFQLANFIRDIDEDLRRGRVYLPMEDLERFGVSRDDLEARVVTDRVRALLQFQIARVRRLEARSRPGIALLHPTSRPCIDAARVLYCGIVDAVEAIDYQVFATRASVPMSRRLAVAGPAWLRAIAARRRNPALPVSGASRQ